MLTMAMSRIRNHIPVPLQNAKNPRCTSDFLGPRLLIRQAVINVVKSGFPFK